MTEDTGRDIGNWVYLRDATPVRARQVETREKKTFDIVFSNGAILHVIAELEQDYDRVAMYQHAEIEPPPIEHAGWIILDGEEKDV